MRNRLSSFVFLCFFFAITLCATAQEPLFTTLLNAQNSNVSSANMVVSGYATIGVNVRPASSWNGTVTFESSVDGLSFTAVVCTNRATVVNASTYASTSTAAQFACPVSGARLFRVTTSGTSTGNVTVTALGVAVTSMNLSTGGGGGGGISSIVVSPPLTGGTITSSGTIGCPDALADGSTKGCLSLSANDFDISAGTAVIDYVNTQKASGSQPGALSSTDWNTFNSKVSASRQIIASAPLGGTHDLSTDVTLTCTTCTTNASALTLDLPVFGAGSNAAKIGTKTGNTNTLVTQSGAATSGKCAEYDASGNLIATALSCGAGSGISGATNNGLVYATGATTATSTGAAADGELLIGRTGLAPLKASLTGTANRVTVTAGAGSITLNLPQDFHTAAAVQLSRLGLNESAPGTGGMFAATAAANNVLMFRLKRFTDTSPTNNFVELQNAAGTSLWTIDITGSLTAGTVPLARTTGNLPVSQLNGGTAASGTTFWRGDGTWAAVAASLVTSLTGTVNQVNVSASTGDITLSLPQSIATASAPRFAALGLGEAAGSDGLLITSAGSSCLRVGPAGATSPALQVNCATASAVVGLLITEQAAGSGVLLNTQGGNANEDFIIKSKAQGKIVLDVPTSGGSNNLRIAGSDRLVINNTLHDLTVGNRSAVSTASYRFTGDAPTSLNASTEVFSYVVDMNQTKQHATGALTLQREMAILGPTITFVGASTLTHGTTVGISGPPICGSNATCTKVSGLNVATRVMTNTTTAYGISIEAPTGATTNRAAEFTGDVLLTGDLIISGTKLRTRTCMIVVGADNASAVLANADLGPQLHQCRADVAMTVVEIAVYADGGTPNVIVHKRTGSTNTDLLSSALATAASGAIACSKTTGVTGLDGATTCSATLQNTAIPAGYTIGLTSGTAGGVAKRMTVAVTMTIDT